MNRFGVKKQRRIQRYQHKKATRGCMPHCGLIVTKPEVKNHRYLREHGLRHIPELADVKIEPTVKRDERFNVVPSRDGFRIRRAASRAA